MLCVDDWPPHALEARAEVEQRVHELERELTDAEDAGRMHVGGVEGLAYEVPTVDVLEGAPRGADHPRDRCAPPSPR
jgi:hypothetical protein